MLATNSLAKGIAGQLSAASLAWFARFIAFVAAPTSAGTRRRATATAVAGAVDRSQNSRSGTGDAPYEHR